MKRLRPFKWPVLIPAILLYAGLAVAPATLWLNSRSISVSSVALGEMPTVIEDRYVRLSFDGAYSVTVWRVLPDNRYDLACNGSGEVPYRAGIDGVKTYSLVDYADGAPACAHLQPGTYYLEVTRTVLRPLWGVLPPKTARWTSSPFIVSEGG